MLTKTKKKDVFLSLLNTVFEDESSLINEQNCVGFYHLLLDNLEKELNLLNRGDRQYYLYVNQVVEILSSFHLFLEIKPDLEVVFKCRKRTKKLLLLFLQISENEYVSHFNRIKNHYNLVKNQFLN